MEVMLRIFFLIFSKANVSFLERELIWRFYITAEALLTTKQVKLINKKEFVKADCQFT